MYPSGGTPSYVIVKQIIIANIREMCPMKVSHGTVLISNQNTMDIISNKKNYNSCKILSNLQLIIMK